MQQTLTVCVFLTENFEEETNYEFLEEQNWGLASLFVFGFFKNIQRFQIKYPKLRFKYGLNDKSIDFKNINSEFIIFCSPFELWDKNYVEKTYEFLKGKNDLNILYQTGFLMQNRNRVEYSQIALKELNTPFSIDKMFYENAWFSRFFKFIYSTSVLKDFKISLNLEKNIKGFRLYCINLNINYLAALYEINGFSSPKADYMPAPFLVPIKDFLTKNDVWKIRQYLFLKRNIWVRNPWNKIAWKCWWFERYYKI